MKGAEISALLERIAPVRLASSWDNVGWQVGNRYIEVQAVLLAVDFSEAVLKEALAVGANLIVTHHPFLFRPLSKIDLTDTSGKLIEGLIKNEISLYAAHTNLDAAAEGVSFALAESLGLNGIRPLRLLPEAAAMQQGDPTEVLSLTSQVERLGWGAVGELTTPITTADFMIRVQDRLGPLVARIVLGREKEHKRIAVCGGSGSDFIHDAALKATLYITADVKYHQAQEAEELGLTLIDIPHYHSERPVLGKLAEYLRSRTNLPVLVSSISTSPFLDGSA